MDISSNSTFLNIKFANSYERIKMDSAPPNPPASADQLPPEALALAARLFEAARSGQIDIFEQALTRGLKPNMTNEKGDSLVGLFSSFDPQTVFHSTFHFIGDVRAGDNMYLYSYLFYLSGLIFFDTTILSVSILTLVPRKSFA